MARVVREGIDAGDAFDSCNFDSLASETRDCALLRQSSVQKIKIHIDANDGGLQTQNVKDRPCPFSMALQEELSEQLAPLSEQDYATPLLSQNEDAQERFLGAQEVNDQIILHQNQFFKKDKNGHNAFEGHP